MIYNKTISNETFRLCHIHDLYAKKNDVLIIKEYINNDENCGLVSQFENYEESNLSFKFSDDGSSFPIPYSIVNNYFLSNPIQEYLNSASHLNNKIDDKFSSNPISHFIDKIEKLGIKRLKFNKDVYLSPISFRRLNKYKNGIDLHCENSFKDDLIDEFKNKILENLNLENILSFYIVLQKPISGGELIIYNHEWNDVKLPKAELTEKNRKNKKGSILDNYSTKKTESTYFDINTNELVIFRGAQIYHAINNIHGNIDRITVGGFIGQSNSDEDKFYYWA